MGSRSLWFPVSSHLQQQNPPLQVFDPMSMHYAHLNSSGNDDSRSTYTRGSYDGEGMITYAIQSTSSSGRSPPSPKNLAFSQTPRTAPYPLLDNPRMSSDGRSTAPLYRDARSSPSQEQYYNPSASELYNRAQALSISPPPSSRELGSSPTAGNYHSPSPATGGSITRLPPILQVEKQQVTTSATQLASASRRRNEAHFVCPVPGCGSTFTRRFNLRGHLRSHTEERPYVCEWPGCGKGFARQHDCKRHQTLHATKSQANVCRGCKKTFSRLDALNRHLRSEGGAECRQAAENDSLAQSHDGGASPTNRGSPVGRKVEEEDWEMSNHRSLGSAGRY